MSGGIISATRLMFHRSWMLTSTFRRSTWIVIWSIIFVNMEPCNSILPYDMNQYIYQTSRMVGTRPIGISTTCRKYAALSIAFSASKTENSISKPTLSIGRTVLPLAKSSLLVLIWLPPWASSQMQSPNSLDPKTAVMESILTLWWKTSENYLTTGKMQCTAWQYTAVSGRLSSIEVITICMYRMNTCRQWRSVFSMVLRFQWRVKKVNEYVRFVNGV